MNTKGALRIAYVFPPLGYALLQNDQQVPITHFFNNRAEPCGPEDAASCVCGQDGVGWWALDLRKFEHATVQ